MSIKLIADDGGDTLKLMDLGEVMTPIFRPTPEASMELFRNIPKLQLRDDDILLSSFAKTGIVIYF